MAELPDFVCAYLYSLTSGERSPAFLLVGQPGTCSVGEAAPKLTALRSCRLISQSASKSFFWKVCCHFQAEQ